MLHPPSRARKSMRAETSFSCTSTTLLFCTRAPLRYWGDGNLNDPDDVRPICPPECPLAVLDVDKRLLDVNMSTRRCPTRGGRKFWLVARRFLQLRGTPCPLRPRDTSIVSDRGLTRLLNCAGLPALSSYVAMQDAKGSDPRGFGSFGL